MKSIFSLSKVYRELSQKISTYSQSRIPILIMGNTGSRRDEFVIDILNEENVPYAEISGGDYWSRERFAKKWEESCETKTIVLCRLEDFQQDIQLYINTDLTKRKESKELPWIVSTSGLGLRNLVQRKQFREDLYYRLGVVTFDIPPLFHRKLEIMPIAQYLLDLYSKMYKKRLKYFDGNLVEFLTKFNYPGDLDQLDNLIESLVVAGKGRTLEFSNLPTTFYKDSNLYSERVIPIIPGVTMKEYEKEIILENLRINNGNREKTAKILDISVRTLYRKLDEFNQNEFISP